MIQPRTMDPAEKCSSSGQRFRLTDAERASGQIKCPKCGYVAKLINLALLSPVGAVAMPKHKRP